ncbi:MAG: 6-carboxytetrahydropterin synthase [Arenicella sp.]|jgi:6-pyruvoyltetrahydropterin/6-carboxytetrahydropterin synthase|nr:6-carboxytetrahydropterin synthase [Arenicella sp.]
MFEIVKSIEFCYGHRLLEHPGLCANLHGHNAKADVMLGSETLDHLGMVMDFSDVKAVLKSWIDATLDHTLILCKDDPMVEVLKTNGERFYLMDDNPTAENIAKLIYKKAQTENLPVVSVTLWESDSSFARYSE